MTPPNESQDHLITRFKCYLDAIWEMSSQLNGNYFLFVKVATNGTFVLVYINRQDPERLFHEEAPENLDEANKEVMIAATYGHGTDGIGWEPDTVRIARQQAEKTPVNEERHLNKQKNCRNASFVDEYFFDRMAPDRKVRTTEEAEDYTRVYLNSLCDPTKAIERQRLMHFPKCWDKRFQDWVTNDWLLLPKSELDPIRTLQSLRLLLELDQFNIQFDTWQFLQSCSEILTDVLEELRDDAELGEKVQGGLFKMDPMHLAKLLISSAAGEEDTSRIRPNTPRVRLQRVQRVYTIMQRHYLREDVTKPGEKTWRGDACIAKMVTIVGEERRGDHYCPEAFFDGRGLEGRYGRITDEDTGSAAAVRLYAN
jgi:hypothetical protein